MRFGSVPQVKPEALTPVTFTPPAFPAAVGSTAGADGVATGAAQQNGTGHAIEITVRCGVISAANQNGHIYVETAPDNGGSPGTWVRWGDYVACRNQTGAAAPIGMGHGLRFRVAKSGWYRFVIVVIANYGTPTFVNDGANSASFIILD
jgi:hypothetical protein